MAQLSFTGINTELEKIVLNEITADILEVDEINRRILSCQYKGADKVVIVLPTGAVFEKQIKSINSVSIEAFAKQIFRTLGA